MMGKLSRGKICYNLHESPFDMIVSYGPFTIKYYFSSQLYRANFIKQMHDNRERIKTSLSKRFGFHVENDVLADLWLYKTIEKRGFLIKYKGQEYECQEHLRLDGNHLMMKN